MTVNVKTIVALALCLLTSFCVCIPSIAQEDGQVDEKKESSSVLDDDSLFGGINFVKGMKKSGSEGAQDEIEGEVEVTTNPYTSIPEPTGLIAGIVYEPSKDGKQPSSSSADMITGLANLLNAMQSTKK